MREIEVRPVISFHKGRKSEVNGERSLCGKVTRTRTACQDYKFKGISPLGVVIRWSRGTRKEHDLT